MVTRGDAAGTSGEDTDNPQSNRNSARFSGGGRGRGGRGGGVQPRLSTRKRRHDEVDNLGKDQYLDFDYSDFLAECDYYSTGEISAFRCLENDEQVNGDFIFFFKRLECMWHLSSASPRCPDDFVEWLKQQNEDEPSSVTEWLLRLRMIWCESKSSLHFYEWCTLKCDEAGIGGEDSE